jgi:hypothetical protein
MPRNDPNRPYDRIELGPVSPLDPAYITHLRKRDGNRTWWGIERHGQPGLIAQGICDTTQEAQQALRQAEQDDYESLMESLGLGRRPESPTD